MKKKTFAVIGLGKFGYAVAETLAKSGYEVLAVDGDNEKVTIEMNPQEPLRAGQSLVIVGKNEILSRLSETNYQD